MLRPCGIIVLIAFAGACATRTITPRVPREVAAVEGGGGTDEVEALVRLALTLDAAGDRRADTLYSSDALIVGNAQVRLAAPRFAGITSGSTGRVTITAANATVEGRGVSGLSLGQPGRAACGSRPGDVHL